MMRPADQEMAAHEKIVCYSQFPRKGDPPGQGGPHRDTPGSVRSQKGQEENRKTRAGAFIVVPTGTARQGKQA